MGLPAASAASAAVQLVTLSHVPDADAQLLRTQVLLLENDINTTPFTPAVHACVPPLPWSVQQSDVDDPHRCDAPVLDVRLHLLHHERVSRSLTCQKQPRDASANGRQLWQKPSKQGGAPSSQSMHRSSGSAQHQGHCVAWGLKAERGNQLALGRREDLRHLPVCSVDPPGCRDIDDALHIRQLPGGTLEVGVHIADVTHFLHPGTAMDEEAASRWVPHMLMAEVPAVAAPKAALFVCVCPNDDLCEPGLGIQVSVAKSSTCVLQHPLTGALKGARARRATTTYLVERRIDMLPKPLTEDICSLRGNVERLAFSVLWEMDAGANALSVRFTKSVIK